jgi:hypothetical protein
MVCLRFEPLFVEFMYANDSGTDPSPDQSPPFTIWIKVSLGLILSK